MNPGYYSNLIYAKEGNIELKVRFFIFEKKLGYYELFQIGKQSLKILNQPDLLSSHFDIS